MMSAHLGVNTWQKDGAKKLENANTKYRIDKLTKPSDFLIVVMKDWVVPKAAKRKKKQTPRITTL